MDYERLPVILKRYSFIEKMRVLQYYSKQIMNINGIELTSGQPMAWELETFLLFAQSKQMNITIMILKVKI